VLKDGAKRTYGRKFGSETTAIAENGMLYGISTLSGHWSVLENCQFKEKSYEG
jgi:hypothetical protein